MNAALLLDTVVMTVFPQYLLDFPDGFSWDHIPRYGEVICKSTVLPFDYFRNLFPHIDIAEISENRATGTPLGKRPVVRDKPSDDSGYIWGAFHSFVEEPDDLIRGATGEKVLNIE